MITEAELWQEVEIFFQKNFDAEKGIATTQFLHSNEEEDCFDGKQKYTKDDKLNILHIAVCRLLEPFGYYRFSHYDDDGYPHFEEIESLPDLKPNEQKILIKKAIIQYFIDEKLFSQQILDKVAPSH